MSAAPLPADRSAFAGSADYFSARRLPLKVWAVAGCAAVALHAAALGAAFIQAPSEEGDDLGSPAIEVGIELASPRREVTDLPPGPDSDAAAASTASIQQKAVPDEQQLPEAKPTETEDPDRVVTPERAEKPKEPDPTPVQQESQASAESVASEATAMPSTEAVKEAPVSVAPTPGVGDSLVKVRTTWQRRLVSHLDRNKRYPPGGSRRAVQTVVSFTIDRTGHILRADVARSSGDADFDQAALAMLRRSDPVPAPPPLVADEGLTFTVPVVFRAKGRA